VVSRDVYARGNWKSGSLEVELLNETVAELSEAGPIHRRISGSLEVEQLGQSTRLKGRNEKSKPAGSEHLHILIHGF